MKTIYGHPIINEKGIEYVLFKDYVKLLEIIESQQLKIEDTKNFVKLLYKGDYISEFVGTKEKTEVILYVVCICVTVCNICSTYLYTGEGRHRRC